MGENEKRKRKEKVNSMSGIGNLGEIQTIDFLKKEFGFAIYLPLKDIGIDFIGVKRDSLFQFQIKTSAFQKNRYFWFKLNKRKMVYGKNIYYIFVCYTMPRHNMMGKAKNYIIIPSFDLKKWILSSRIPLEKGSNSVCQIFLHPDITKK